MKKLQTTEKPAKYHLRIAEGAYKPNTLSDIEAASILIRRALHGTNDCEGKEALKKCDNLLWAVLTDNE